MSTELLKRLPTVRHRLDAAADEVKQVEIARADGTLSQLSKMEKQYPDTNPKHLCDDLANALGSSA